MTRTTTPARVNRPARKRLGLGRLSAWIAIAGFVAVLACPPAQAADWSTNVIGTYPFICQGKPVKFSAAAGNVSITISPGTKNAQNKACGDLFPSLTVDVKQQ
jgi:hypothetical protein